MVLRNSAQAELKLSIGRIGQADVTRVIADPIELFEDEEHQARVVCRFLSRHLGSNWHHMASAYAPNGAKET